MSLADADRRLLRLFLACVQGRWDEVRRARYEAAEGEPDRRWREAVLQVHLFAGVPRMVEACAVLEAAGGLGAPEAGEVEAPDAGEVPSAVADSGDRRARGRALFERIYQRDSPAVRAMLERAHPDLARWVEEHAYGRVLAREGLAADRRELLAVVALAALGQERQLLSHARGSLRCGASPADLRECLEVVADLIEPARVESARRLVARVAAG